MSNRRSYLLAFLFGVGGLLAFSAPRALSQDKKPDGGVMLSKTESLADADAKDTKLKESYCKTYKIQMKEGTAYRIDLSSTDFDTFLRLEDSKKKELAFNDDIAPPNDLNSRLIFVAPKTAEYTLVATSFKPGDTGEFKLVVKLATPEEAKDAVLLAKASKFWDLPRADQKKFMDELTKSFKDKGEKLTLQDAQLAAGLFFGGDDSDPKYLREMGETFAKIFEGASNKQLAGFSKQITFSLKSLEIIGTKFEVTGMKTDGKDFDLKTLKGKVVLVDFWATWCGPCIAELPNVEAAYKKYHGKGFDVIGISLDRPGDDEKLAKFMENRKTPWGCINIEDSRKLADKYKVNAIPYPVLIDQAGNVVSVRARGPQLERLLDRLLSEKK